MNTGEFPVYELTRMMTQSWMSSDMAPGPGSWAGTVSQTLAEPSTIGSAAVNYKYE